MPSPARNPPPPILIRIASHRIASRRVASRRIPLHPIGSSCSSVWMPLLTHTNACCESSAFPTGTFSIDPMAFAWYQSKAVEIMRSGPNSFAACHWAGNEFANSFRSFIMSACCRSEILPEDIAFILTMVVRGRGVQTALGRANSTDSG